MHDDALVREAEILSYEVLDRPELEPLQTLARLVADLLGVTMAEINAVTGSHTVHLATSDGHRGNVPLEHSFCSRAVLRDERTMIVHDAAQHPTFASSPYVDGSIANISFYAGAQLVTPRGVSIGTVCVWNDQPMTFSEEQREQLEGFADVVTNVLELRRDNVDAGSTLQRLVNSHRQVTRSNESLESFAGQVSHDLRTPLSAVHLALSMLGEIPAVQDDVTAHRLTSRAQAVSQRMQRTLEDLMDFATLGNTVQPDPVPMADVVHEALEDLAGVSADVRIEVDEASLPVVLAYWSHVRAVLQNLVGNAVKYAGAARSDAIVRVRGSRTSQGGRVEVSDNGPGIPAELRTAVFDAEVRGDHPEIEGHGVGLATCARLIEAMGGSIGLAESDEGGCTFWFELPLATVEGSQ